MAGHTRSNDAGQVSKTTTPSRSTFPRASTAAVWTLFVLGLGALALSIRTGTEWTVEGVVRIDGLTALMWVVVTFFSGIVHSYSRRYMAGDARIDGFFARVLAFTLVVMAMTAADHVALFAATWLAMGLLMAGLIGHERDWAQARAAAGV
ncbi:oxidoreductase, partial [Natronoarchaeum mannanilyticum]